MLYNIAIVINMFTLSKMRQELMSDIYKLGHLSGTIST